MDCLPPELWMMIGEYLTLPELSRLAQTCNHLHDVMFDTISNRVKMEELVITGDKDILNKEFIQRYVSTQIKRVKIVVPELTRTCVNFLQDVFEVSNGIEGVFYGIWFRVRAGSPCSEA